MTGNAVANLLERNPPPTALSLATSHINRSSGSKLLVRDWLSAFGYSGIREKALDAGGVGFMLDRCPFDPSHKGTEVMISQSASGALGFKCMHASCAKYKWEDAKLAIGNPRGEHWDPPKQLRNQSTGPTSTKPSQSRSYSDSNENGNGLVRQFKFLNGLELAAGEFKIEFLIKGVLVRYQSGVLGAPSKTMKTTTILDAGLSLATGKPFLGRFEVTAPVRVGIMTGESGMGTVQETVARIAESKGLNPRDYSDNFHVCDEVPFVRSIPDLNGVEHAIRDLHCDVLITDPVYQMIDGTEAGNIMQMGQQLKLLSDICKAEGVTLWLVHHIRRGSDNRKNFEPMGLEDLSWAGFAEFARQWFFLNRRERFVEGTGNHNLWFNYGGSAGHSGLWALDIYEGANDASQGREYEVTITNARDARQQLQDDHARERESKAEQRRNATLDARCERVIDVFHNRQEWLTSTKIKERTGTNSEVANEAIAKLVERGKLEIKSDKICGVNRDVYRLKTSIPDNRTTPDKSTGQR